MARSRKQLKFRTRDRPYASRRAFGVWSNAPQHTDGGQHDTWSRALVFIANWQKCAARLRVTTK